MAGVFCKRGGWSQHRGRPWALRGTHMLSLRPPSAPGCHVGALTGGRTLQKQNPLSETLRTSNHKTQTWGVFSPKCMVFLSRVWNGFTILGDRWEISEKLSPLFLLQLVASHFYTSVFRPEDFFLPVNSWPSPQVASESRQGRAAPDTGSWPGNVCPVPLGEASEVPGRRQQVSALQQARL